MEPLVSPQEGDEALSVPRKGMKPLVSPQERDEALSIPSERGEPLCPLRAWRPS